MRITTSMLTAQVVGNLGRSLARFARIEEQLSSARRINRPSDDPIGLVRVLEYETLLEGGSRGERVRLSTTILEPGEAPAQDLARLYAERWSIETGYDELKTHLRGPGRVLRSQLPELVEQELIGFMLAYYVVRTVMLEAAQRSGLPPGDLSFTHTVRVIRRKLAFPPSGHTGPAQDV